MKVETYQVPHVGCALGLLYNKAFYDSANNNKKKTAFPLDTLLEEMKLKLLKLLKLQASKYSKQY